MTVQKFLLGIVIVVCCKSTSFAQSKVEVGAWYTHASYLEGRDLVEMDKILYYAVKNAVAAIDLRDNSLQILDKKAGLSDVGIRCLGSSPQAKMLVICYENSNVDLYNGKTIFNVPDIYNKQIIGNKTINRVFCDAQYAYLACGMGIVVVDLKKKVIKDTWLFKKDNQMYEVNDMVILNDTVYAATDYGIFYAKRNNSFINNFAVWEKVENMNTPNNTLFRQFAVFNNTVYVLKRDSAGTDTKPAIYFKNKNLWEELAIDMNDSFSNFDCRFIRVSSNRLVLATNMEVQRYQWNTASGKWEREFTYSWCYGTVTAVHAADEKTYIVDIYGLRQGGTNGYAAQVLIPGPAQDPATAMDWKKSKLAVVHNATEDLEPTWSRANVSILRGEEDWIAVNQPSYLPYMVDFVDVCIAPYDTSIV